MEKKVARKALGGARLPNGLNVLPGKSIGTIYLMGYANKRAEPWSCAVPQLGARLGQTTSSIRTVLISLGDIPDYSGASPYQRAS
jgi:hypothetical protein